MQTIADLVLLMNFSFNTYFDSSIIVHRPHISLLPKVFCRPVLSIVTIYLAEFIEALVLFLDTN